jgi:2-polyprenyl-3-methyl-5-hydroxy-6-metoxy-1,4-benzoquinol methylase
MQMTLQDAERSYWEQRLGPDVPLHSVGFHGLSNSFVSWLYRLRARRFLSMARPYARADMRVLDVGTGGGFYLSLWQRLGVRDLTATDLTEASLTAVRRRFPAIRTARFDVGDPNLPLEEGAFDAITCMDVMHHIMDDVQYDQAMRNFARLLKPGGVLIFTDNFLHAAQAYVGPHSANRPLPHIERSLSAAGFTVRARRPMFVLMNNPVDSSSALFKFYWKALSFLCENAVFGLVAGALLYPIELLLTSLLHEGPSTEICVAQRA